MRLLLFLLCSLVVRADPPLITAIQQNPVVDQIIEYRYPIIYTNCGVVITNFVAYGQSYGSVTVTWQSEPGKTYAVESSHSVVTTQNGPLYTGDAWEPVSLPITASETFTRWTGGVQSEIRFFRVREITHHEKTCDCCFLWEWMR